VARPAITAQAVLHLAKVLGTTGVPYAFMGGLALNAWGIPRTTFDFDVAVALDSQQLPGFLRGLEAHDLAADEPFLRGHVDRLSGMEKCSARLLFGSHWFVVDIFLATTPFLRSVMTRRVQVPVWGESVFVVSAADLILFKLVAGRRKDWVDIENVVAIQGIPDPGYLATWAALLGVQERLARVVRPE
jgi:hypothetical protein